MMKYLNKRLLVLGGVPMLVELVRYAQSEGAYVIVADYHEKTYCKSVADEAWNISTADTDRLAERALAAGVSGVISGFDDFNVRCCRLLADRIGCPFYAGLDQISQTMDKQNFKNLCVAHGVPATEQVDLDQVPIEAVPYPVIVKPVDGSGNRGITICHRAADLERALAHAKATSKKGRLLCERYVVGPEVGINYLLQDGDMCVSAMHDRYMVKGDPEGRHPRLPLAYVYPSKYLSVYLEREDQAVQAMFRAAGLENGTLFMQGCFDGAAVRFYEMGYRLNGAKQYQIIERACGVNPMHAIVDHTLLGRMGETRLTDAVDARYRQHYCTLSVLVRPGRIARYVGLDDLENADDLNITVWLKPGDELDAAAIGTQKQIAVRITIQAETVDRLVGRIDEINRVLRILDDQDSDMIVERFDTGQVTADGYPSSDR